MTLGRVAALAGLALGVMVAVRLALIALIAVALIGCSRERVSKPLPTAPTVRLLPPFPLFELQKVR